MTALGTTPRPAQAAPNAPDSVSHETRRSLEKDGDLVPAGVPGLEDLFPPLVEEAALFPGRLPRCAELREAPGAVRAVQLEDRRRGAWSNRSKKDGLSWPLTGLSLLGMA
jgi:hypothetical protein